jgi:hypothetical protein
MEKMTTIAVGIEMTKEQPRKNYILIDGNERYFLSLTNEQKDFFDWLDNYGMISCSCTIEDIEKIEFEKI